MECRNATEEPSEANLVRLLDLWSADWKHRGRTRAVGPGAYERSGKNNQHQKLQRRFENFSKNFQNSPRKIKLSEATPQKTLISQGALQYYIF